LILNLVLQLISNHDVMRRIAVEAIVKKI